MSEQVIVSNSRIEVRLHELPVGVLQKALDRRLLSGDRRVVFRGDGFAERRAANTPENKNCRRRPVAELAYNWRGWPPANTGNSFASDGVKLDFPYSKTPFMPAFSLLCDLQIALIANGEKLLEETNEDFGLPIITRQPPKVQIPPSYRTAGFELII